MEVDVDVTDKNSKERARCRTWESTQRMTGRSPAKSFFPTRVTKNERLRRRRQMAGQADGRRTTILFSGPNGWQRHGYACGVWPWCGL